MAAGRQGGGRARRGAEAELRSLSDFRERYVQEFQGHWRHQIERGVRSILAEAAPREAEVGVSFLVQGVRQETADRVGALAKSYVRRFFADKDGGDGVPVLGVLGRLERLLASCGGRARLAQKAKVIAWLHKTRGELQGALEPEAFALDGAGAGLWKAAVSEHLKVAFAKAIERTAGGGGSGTVGGSRGGASANDLVAPLLDPSQDPPYGYRRFAIARVRPLAMAAYRVSERTLRERIAGGALLPKYGERDPILRFHLPGRPKVAGRTDWAVHKEAVRFIVKYGGRRWVWLKHKQVGISQKRFTELLRDLEASAK